MKLKEIPRTATFAWLPDASPQLVTGTAAGTIDPDFSAATALELWKLDLLDHSVAGFTAESTGRVETDARFHDLAVSDDGRYAAAALENGVVNVWDLPSLAEAGRNNSAHSGPVKSVGWSRKERQKFATGGSSGQVFVWDVAALDKPFAPGNATTTRHDDVSSVAWNNHAAQILATTGNSGFTSIWDTRRRREVLHLHYTSSTGSRVPVSDVQWHPTNSTQLLTCSADDSEPVICLWDLRNVNSPEKVLRGHTKGVLSADWCRQDPSLLLSGGRDNQTLLWNPETETPLGAYPISVEWAFKTQFHPRMPDLFATASFDGKVTVQTLQDTHSDSKQPASTRQGDDFWESDTVMDAVHPSFKLQQAPKWLQRPVSAKFGFGGKLAVIRKDTVEIVTGKESTSEIVLAKELGEALKTKSFDALVSGAETEGGWELLSAVARGENVPIPDEPLASTAEDEDDDFSIVPQYTPEGEFSLLDKSHASVVKALLKGDYDAAVTKLVANGEAGDALLVASFGGPDLVKRAQNAYLSAQAAERPYLRVAWSVAGQHLDDLAEHSELAAWPTVVETVKSSPEAVTKLGNRLAAAGERDNALRVFLAGRNVASAANLWLDELPALEKSLAQDKKTTVYVAHVLALQQVVKKLAVATSKLGLPPLDAPGADRLYSAFRDYANVAAQQGDLELAKQFLDLLPEQYSAEKQRVDVATQQTAAARPGQKTPGSRPGALPSRLTGTHQAPANPTRAVTSASAGRSESPAPSSPVASGLRAQASTARPTGRRYVANPYAPSPTASSPFSGPSIAGTTVAAAAAGAGATVPPPPPVAGAVPNGVHPPPRVGNKTGWNDIPDLPASEPVRRPTAPQVIAPPAGTPHAPQSKFTPSPRGSQASVAPPPPVGAPRPAAPPIPAAGAPPATAVVPPTAIAPPVAGARGATPANPYAAKTTTRAGSSTKPNPYAPSPSDTPQSSVSPSPMTSRPVSRAAAPPPRARPVAPPPPAAKVAPPPPAASAAPAPVPVQAASPASGSVPAPAPPPVASAAKAAAAPPAVSTPVATPPPRMSASSSPSTGRKGVDAAQIPADAQPIYTGFSAELQRIRPIIEAQYAKQYKDTARRLDILYDNLARQNALTETTVSKLLSLASLLTHGDYDGANGVAVDIIANHSSETGEWMTGVKRLVQMAKAVPV